MIRTIDQDIILLPPKRPTIGHLRVFLSDLAMQYYSLATAAGRPAYACNRPLCNPGFSSFGGIRGIHLENPVCYCSSYPLNRVQVANENDQALPSILRNR